MVHNGCHLAACWQKVCEMALPARWVLPCPPAVCAGIVEDRLDASADAGCGLRLRGPDRLQDLCHLARLNPTDGHILDYGIDVRLQRSIPLPRVLLIAPCGSVRLYVGLSGCLE